MKSAHSDKELYRQLRLLSPEKLWAEEAARFDQAAPAERLARVAVVRAVGVVFSEKGTPAQKSEARAWLSRLLQDPAEKVRRYAMAALPKMGSGPKEEAELLALLQRAPLGREKKFLSRSLEKIGGAATLEAMEAGQAGLQPQARQKIKASVTRGQSPGAIAMDGRLAEFAGLRIQLHCRRGLEQIVREEAEEHIKSRRQFRLAEVRTGLVALTPIAPFALGDLYAMRCPATFGFVAGLARGSSREQFAEALASLIASPLSRRVLKAFSKGPIRYRLDFKGHQRALVRLVADAVYAAAPELLNDASEAPWTVAVKSAREGDVVELAPRIAPDPRFYYRQDDVPAASHPPLAACLARVAGPGENEIVWDPFCGSGQELIERGLLAGARLLLGTDRSPEAIAVAEKNFAAARLNLVQARFVCRDFREFASIDGLKPGSVSLVITNPPMGKRVPIPDLQRLIEDLFRAAAAVLRPGGRLVFANPLRIGSPVPSLKLHSRQIVDMGGFDCRLEVYRK